MNMKESSLPKYISEPEYYKNKQFMFLDISGFTPLCDKFISESSYGAEKIGDLINIVFNPIIDSVYAAGGDVISFAGDALFVAVDKEKVSAVKKMSDRIIKEQTIDRNLSIKIEMFDKPFVPVVINSESSSCFCYAPNKLKKEIIKNDPFPQEIYDIYKSSFRGELRAVPIFFIRIDEKYSVEKIKSLLSELSEEAKTGSVYINKIEYLDKGWMILLSAGSPVYSTDAPVKMYELLSVFSKKAETMKIPVQIGGTLQRGYCGIIGNEKRWEFTFLGSNVNLAARIAAKAEPYKVYADSSFASAVKTSLKAVSAGKKEYKGVGEREIFEITGILKDKKNIFVGRIEEIKTSLDFFKGDRRAFVLLNGPSGIGKTVLAEQIILSLGYKNLLRFKGIYGEENENYLFRNLSAANKNDPAEIFQKFKAITEPTLIYIDDLHFADEKSLFMFHRMINEGNPFINFIATTIGREKIRITPLAYYESLIIDLKPFDAKDIQAITKIASGIDISLKVSRDLQRSTGGNPLFVTGILPYITKDIERSGDVPYSLQEVILLKLNQIPGKGPEFIDGGSVYGDIFDHKVLKDVINARQAIIREIIQKAENEGLVRKSLVNEDLEFSNTIIREIIYERLLKKKIDFFRIRIAEAIIRSKTKDMRKMYKAMMMFFLADDERALKLAIELAEVFRKRSDVDILRNIFLRSFEYIIKHEEYGKGLDLLKILSKSGHLNIGSEVTGFIEKIALNVKDWQGEEKLILDLARTIHSVQFKEPVELLNTYKKLKGEDKYYKWTRIKVCAYTIPHKEATAVLKGLMNSFEGNEKISFYFDLVWYVFFITGDTVTEKKAMSVLESMELKMDNGIKVDFYFLKNTIAMHRDDLTESKRCLDIVQKLDMKESDDRFVFYNDLAILHSNLAYENFDADDIRKALKYSVKAQKLLNDNQKDSDLPLITTNLAGFYMSSGFIKKAERAYMEGLYFGLAINHPVEIPYTKSRIAIIAMHYGAYRLASEMSDEVISADVGDIKSGAYAIRYYYSGRNENDLKQAYKFAKNYAEFGTAKCYWEMASIMLYNALVTNNKEEMKKLRNKIISWNKYQQRAGTRFVNEAHVEILGLLTGNKSDETKVQHKLDKIAKLNANFGVMNKCYFALGVFRKDPELLIKAKKYALKMKSYPFVQRIEEELFRITNDKYWESRLKKTQEKLEQMNRIGSIEELLGFKK
ncbi:TPA: hypothetical protein DCR49_04285 [Candidatus Delongbacteria bacterium]|nr:hypothetical protein [Candidatus Delongbacteria bacterium]